MISFLKKYKAFIYGLIIQRVVVYSMLYFDFIHIDKSEVLANTLMFLFSWLIISLPIHYFSFILKHKKNALKLGVLFGLFLVVIVNDLNSKIVDNPITFVGLTFIALGFVSIIATSFFKKYAFVIIGFYVLALSYFIYMRIYIDDLNEYLQQEKEIKIILVIPFFILLLSWMYQQWKWLKTIESKKDKAELALLKSQINPHFFFNTLNNLYGLTVEKSNDAPNVVLKLSDMMRYTIYMGKEDFVLLKDEIEYLKNYIELHKIRYEKSVDIWFDYVDESAYQIAPLLFIIPLENAFKHGVESLIEDAYIHINLKAEDGKIQFDIENNFERKEADETAGIGLENLEQRLKLLYPGKHALDISITSNLYKLSLKIETI